MKHETFIFVMVLSLGISSMISSKTSSQTKPNAPKKTAIAEIKISKPLLDSAKLLDSLVDQKFKVLDSLSTKKAENSDKAYAKTAPLLDETSRLLTKALITKDSLGKIITVEAIDTTQTLPVKTATPEPPKTYSPVQTKKKSWLKRLFQ